ncbi:rhomboid family intramembrane serine protease [Pyrobaculum ferrireducens]|uniref:Rhomboid family protein n=1 Tax=Pyrobaculum ferrireducens TaxID=1104324 RepID=G7VD25_9CREN|nr:rhomboid family intramembrane serine protease [Pyrobaculum ferrireducens]AET33904.1 Rhomboid family protein [Pyrobaculum ferrireducens]
MPRWEDEEEDGKWTHGFDAAWRELQDTSPRHSPDVTYGLIIVNVIVFLVTLGMMFENPWAVGVTASEFVENPLNPKVILSMFAHAGVLHILGNMLFLYKYGDNVEAAMGRLRYLVFYMACGYVAVAAQVLFASAVGTPRYMLAPMMGASGAISGVLGAYIYLWPGSTTYRCFCIRFSCYCMKMSARYDIAIWAGFQFLLPLIEPSVAVFAHMGGFVAGIAMAPIFAKREKVERLREEIKNGMYRGPPPREHELAERGWDGVVKWVVGAVAAAVLITAVIGIKSHMWVVYTVKLEPWGFAGEEARPGSPQPLTVLKSGHHVLVAHGPASNAGVAVSVAIIAASLLLLVRALEKQVDWEIL